MSAEKAASPLRRLNELRVQRLGKRLISLGRVFGQVLDAGLNAHASVISAGLEHVENLFIISVVARRGIIAAVKSQRCESSSHKYNPQYMPVSKQNSFDNPALSTQMPELFYLNR